MSSWFKCNKLSLNIDKTCSIHFKTPQSQSRCKNIFIDDVPIVQKESTKFLGVTLDSNLSWSEQTRKITTTLSKVIGILCKLKHILPQKSLIMLYNALVLPHINYCNIVWANCNQTKLNAIFLLQKRALRLCTNSHYLSHTDPLFKQLKTLKVHDIHTYQAVIFMYKCTQNLLPLFQNTFQFNRDIHSYPTRHRNDFHLNNPKLLVAHRFIRYHGPDVWNSLPVQIKSCTSLFAFKSLLKKHLLLQYDK